MSTTNTKVGDMNPTEPTVDSNAVIELLLNQIRLLSLQVAIADAKTDALAKELEARNSTPVQTSLD